MKKEKTRESLIGGYISTLLRKHFGKGPTSVFVSIRYPYITIHFRGFLAPMEKLQLKHGESGRVLATRDLMMLDIKPEILAGIQEVADLELQEIYADWHLPNESGMMIGVLASDTPGEDKHGWPVDIDGTAVLEKVEEASRIAQKTPEQTDFCWLNDRTLLIRRAGILIRLENELIKSGFAEELRLAKRPLEHDLLEEVGLERTLKRSFEEVFLDWDFDGDVSYMVLLLQPKKR